MAYIRPHTRDRIRCGNGMPAADKEVYGRALTVTLITLALALISAPGFGEDVWRDLEPGLQLAKFTSISNADPESGITVLRIDPRYFSLQLFNASAEDGIPRTPKQWSEAKGLVAAINASMFQQDLSTSVSLMRTEHHVNNAYVSKDNTILAFDPIAADVPVIRIIDRQCDDFDALRNDYKTLIQSIRMVSCDGRNVWRPQSRRSSTSALATDTANRVLFIHTEPEFATRELIDFLLQLPLDIARAMYLEGGPQAQLYIQDDAEPIELTGHLNPILSQGGKLAWPLPNVIGVTRKPHVD